MELDDHLYSTMNYLVVKKECIINRTLLIHFLFHLVYDSSAFFKVIFLGSLKERIVWGFWLFQDL